MSIIFDALQKTQQKREKKPGLDWQITTAKNTIEWVDTILLLLILSLLSVIAYHYFRTVMNHSAHVVAMPAVKQAISAPPVVAQAESVPAPEAMGHALVLNGVYVSNQEKLALINNQSYHLGDMVDDLKIVGIEFNRVTLQSKTGKMTLTS